MSKAYKGNDQSKCRSRNLCNIILEYNGDSMSINIFTNCCDAILDVASDYKAFLLTINLKIN